MEQFINNILDGKKSKRSVVDQLYKLPQKDKYGDQPTIPIIDPNYAHYVDVLYLPNDNGMKYCLLVVDQGSRYVGATAMEDRSVADIVKGLVAIYKNNKYLKIPVLIISDMGSEFRKNFDAEIYNKLGIENHKTLKAGRHRSMLAERKNQTVGKIIGRVLTQVQLTSGNPSSKWVSYLPTIIKAINDKVTKKGIKPKPMDNAAPLTFNPDHRIDLLKEGDQVRIVLDNPIDVAGNKLHGSFRSGDIRWNPEVRTVVYVYMKPNEPVMYFLNGKEKMGNKYVEPFGYTRNQLQRVSIREKDPDEELPLFENELNRYEVQKIIERGINDDQEVMYLVKFKKVRKAVWIRRDSLVEDLGKSFMDKLDKAFDNKILTIQ